uniref:Uncharacterized protein n=1 Tax=Arundo donax TaxID=35708 RepID=A0A0A9BN46_ARUDO
MKRGNQTAESYTYIPGWPTTKITNYQIKELGIRITILMCRREDKSD